MVIELPSDLVKEVGKALNWEITTVNKVFEFEENKQGFFIVSLRQGLNLSTTDFKSMCRLAEDLNGKYLQGERKWRVPGPYAKRKASGDEQEKRLQDKGKDVTPFVVSMDKSLTPDVPNIKFIPVDSVRVPEFLPTRALIKHERLSEIRDSIKKHGLQYPIKVRPGPEPNTYGLKDGYLRLKSVQQLGWKEISAEIKKTSDQEVIVESIITNKHRIQEDPITLAKKLDILVNAFSYTHEKLAEEIGVDRTWVTHVLRLLRLPKNVQHSVALHNVGFYHALLLLTVDDAELQVQLAKEVVERGWSTRELEKRIQEFKPEEERKQPQQPLEPIEHEPAEVSEGPSETFEPSSETRRTVKTERKTDESEDMSFADESTEATEYIEYNEDIGEAREEAKPEPLLTAMEWECPECHQVIVIHHIDHPNGKISHELVKQKRK